MVVWVDDDKKGGEAERRGVPRTCDMKITSVSTITYRQQMKPGAPKLKFAGEPRSTFDTLLVKVETDAGLTGWGEAFPHRV